MDKSVYMSEIQVLKIESDLKDLQNRIINYTARVSVSGDPEYQKIKELVELYFSQVHNGIEIKDEAVKSLQQRWNIFLTSHTVKSNWKSKMLGIIILGVISIPAFYYVTKSKPGYELFVVLPILGLLCYLFLTYKK